MHAALFLAELQDGAYRFIRSDDHGGDDRLLDFNGHSGRRKFRGVVDLDDLAVGGGDAIAHAGRGGDQVDAEFALEALLHDFHVQQAEKAAAKTEAQRDGIFRLVKKCGVVELQLAEGVAQRFVFVRLHGKKSREDHGLDGFKAGQGSGGARGIGDGVAHAGVGHLLDVGDDEAHVAGGELVEDDGLGRKRAEAFHLEHLIIRAEANVLVGAQAALHHANQDDGAAVGVKPGIEDQRAQRGVGGAHGRGNTRDDGFEDFFDSQAAFGADEQSVGSGNGENAFELGASFFGLRGRQIDFINYGDDSEIVLRREKRVGDGLRFHTLAGVDDQQGALARREGARDLVGKIDVAGSVDQVELVFVAVVREVMQANALGLDGDAALALEVHRIEHLGGHFALGERASKLEQAIGQGGFSVVDVRDDAKVANETRIH